MKTSDSLIHDDKSNNAATPFRVDSRILLKFILFIFMLSWMVILSSCFVRGPGRESHDGRHEQHGNNDRHGHDEHHDNDKRH